MICQERWELSGFKFTCNVTIYRVCTRCTKAN